MGTVPASRCFRSRGEGRGRSDKYQDWSLGLLTPSLRHGEGRRGLRQETWLAKGTVLAPVGKRGQKDDLGC